MVQHFQMRAEMSLPVCLLHCKCHQRAIAFSLPTAAHNPPLTVNAREAGSTGCTIDAAPVFCYDARASPFASPLVGTSVFPIEVHALLDVLLAACQSWALRGLDTQPGWQLLEACCKSASTLVLPSEVREGQLPCLFSGCDIWEDVATLVHSWWLPL